MIFCYEGMTDPMLDFKAQSLVIYDGTEHTVTKVDRLTEAYTFVPRKSNTLRTSAHLKNDGSVILYETKYAKRQFYLRGKKYSTPGTGPRWDLKAKGLHGKSWKRAFLRGAGVN